MSMGKARKGIIKNGVLVSVMAFYFSCGKDVFPPDSPDEISSERGAATASLVLHDAEERFSPCAVHRVPCTSPNVFFHLQQFSHQNGATRSAANRIVR
jgi:hypothetical protein